MISSDEELWLKNILSMKVKHSISLLVFGYCFDFVGALLKILHWTNGDTCLILATVLKVSGGLLFLYKITTYPKIKEFLNW